MPRSRAKLQHGSDVAGKGGPISDINRMYAVLHLNFSPPPAPNHTNTNTTAFSTHPRYERRRGYCWSWAVSIGSRLVRVQPRAKADYKSARTSATSSIRKKVNVNDHCTELERDRETRMLVGKPCRCVRYTSSSLRLSLSDLRKTSMRSI
ncbi:uncharacterized protein BT62DRAFT_1011975 [Guyanagaster necrorhizus]|uniref:Uncharacterized protein n=1 Tax=Guyanagaster necrorhizus TaxID=856835 RepID=A0A9P7VIV6_9AGAR|nr:uncharacterized protein BT62DRAFT_1011975 [Guyanagaster necrorhizus MCA 3950]KAG7441165.1 hypothetical protein BT62DRAFT_1011975 [Guyanagaster necrorhizus MCA 3950]